MRARITVDVIGESGRPVREQKVVEISRRTLAIFEMVTESQSPERMVARDVLSHALRALEPSARAQQALAPAGPSGATGGRQGGLASTLGLGLIQEAAAKEGPMRSMGPGPIGFGGSGGR